MENFPPLGEIRSYVKPETVIEFRIRTVGLMLNICGNAYYSIYVRRVVLNYEFGNVLTGRNISE